MSNIFKSALTVFLLFLFYSCYFSEDASECIYKCNENDYLYIKRSVPVPTYSGYKKNTLKTLSNNSPDLNTSPFNILGAFHKIGNGIIGDPNNIDNDGIIDINSILNDKITSKYLFDRKVRETNASMESYSNYEDIDSCYINTKKIDVDLKSLNIGPFSMNSRYTYNKIFNTVLHKDSKDSWGKLDISYHENKIGIETTNAALNRIAMRNISESFLYSLYYSPIEDLVYNKGYLVVAKFFTGGKLLALYNLSSNNRQRVDIKSENISFGIGASFNWGSKNDVSLSFGYDSRDSTYNKIKSNFSSIKCMLKTYGGITDDFIPTVPVNLIDNKINLGNWYSSLSNKNYHTFVDIDDGGLIPITKFILEKNIKDRIYRVLDNMKKNSEFTNSYLYRNEYTIFIPFLLVNYINIIYEDPRYAIHSFSSYEDKSFRCVSASLITRFGDIINFFDKNNFSSLTMPNVESSTGSSISEQVLKDASLKLSSIFKCDINPKDPNDYKSYKTSDFGDIYNLQFSFDPNYIYKYRNPKTNVCYIYEPRYHTGISYYDVKDDDEDDTYITDMYGLTEWVDGLKEKKISSIDIMNNYTIMAL